MRGGRRLKVAVPPVDHEPSWRRLMNRAYVVGDDDLFLWLQRVRKTVERAEREKRRAA